MSAKKLTIVVGAGASKEIGLPTGAELKNRIARLLDIRFDWRDQQSGDYKIAQALRLAVRLPDGRSSSINDHLESAWRIRDAMPQAISIDNFIDVHPGDEKIELCGKLAIVKSILDAERSSLIYAKPGPRETIDFDTADGCWLSALMRLITDRCTADALPARFASLSFVIFNYDRCIEHFLFHALQNFYKLPEGRAAELLKNVSFFHPYGAVGRLPWQGENSVAGFGADVGAEVLLNNARQIKTFTEGTDPESSEIVEIRKAVRDCETLLFLGFAYHRLNMDLLTPPRGVRRTKPIRNFGTAIGISDYDCKAISGEICVIRDCNPGDTVLRNDKASKDIFSEYTRGISLL